MDIPNLILAPPKIGAHPTQRLQFVFTAGTPRKNKILNNSIQLSTFIPHAVRYRNYLSQQCIRTMYRNNEN